MNTPIHPWCVASAQSPTLVVDGDSLGPAQVGMSRTALVRKCPTIADTIWYDAEGNRLAASALRFAGLEVGIAEWSSGGRLETVRVLSPLVATERGIRVGSTVGDLRRTFGRLHVGYDDAGVYAWSDREHNVSYLLGIRITELLSVPDNVAASPEIIPDTGRVQAVIIGGAP